MEEKKGKGERKKKKKKMVKEAPNGYVHVRARRGEATDSHSLAERVLLINYNKLLENELIIIQINSSAFLFHFLSLSRQEERKSVRE